jgi:hypothetical protein
MESLTPCHLGEPQGRVLINAQIAAPLWLSKKLDLNHVAGFKAVSYQRGDLPPQRNW